MTETDHTIYVILLWALPVLLAILAFIGGMAVNQLIKLAKDVNEIKVTIMKVVTEHDSLEKRVMKIEAKLEI